MKLLLPLLLLSAQSIAGYQCKPDTLGDRIMHFQQCSLDARASGINPDAYSEHCYDSAHVEFCEYQVDFVSSREGWL